MAHWVTLVQSHVPFLPPPPEVTKWVGCYLLASSFLPRNYPGTLLRPSLPMPDPTRPQLTMFFFLLEFRLPAFPVAQACCSLFWSLQIAPPSIHSTLVPPHLLSVLGLPLQPFSRQLGLLVEPWKDISVLVIFWSCLLCCLQLLSLPFFAL